MFVDSSRIVGAMLALMTFTASASDVHAVWSAPAHRRTGVLPVAIANDNRRSAGTMHGDTLVLNLDVRMGRWYPETSDGPFVETPVIGEVGQAPQVPGPLIRVREGTIIDAHITNALADSSITMLGLGTRPGPDSLLLTPGATVHRTFVAGAPGTYLYAVRVGTIDWARNEREQAGAAFVIDAKGARTDDRIFVMNIWGSFSDSVTYQNALTINGRGWPYDERVTAARGDTLRWRIVNASQRDHPMHLHGFFYRIHSRGTGLADSIFAPGSEESVVTEGMAPFSTMGMTWVAEREGNWLFHCHLSFHVAPDARFTPGAGHGDMMSGDMMRHMAGLVLGITVTPGRVARRESRAHARTLRLAVEETPRRARAPRALSYVLQADGDAAPPARLPGTTLVLTRGQPTDITVINRLKEATAVHWHGIELESYSDGVAGWSGNPTRLAPSIAPSDSFTAHLTLRRAGTFIYHTHLNDVEQLTSGLYGAIIVLEPGQRLSPRTDHLFVVGWDGPEDPPHLVVNGDSTPPPLVIAAGVHHRFRFVFIGVVGGNTFRLRKGDEEMQWRLVARDGFDAAPARRGLVKAEIVGWAGQTYDYDFLPPSPGEYTLTAGQLARPLWKGTIVVR